MSLRHLGFIGLPPHAKPGGFDHAAVHAPTGRVYVAHTANDAVDVIDVAAQSYVGAIENLTAVAGVLAVPGSDLLVSSNRGENTVAMFGLDDRVAMDRVSVGVRPNGLAYDPRRARLLVAHVGGPAIPVRARCRLWTSTRGSGSATSWWRVARGGLSTIPSRMRFT